MRETNSDDEILTTEGYTLKDDEYKIFKRKHVEKKEKETWRQLIAKKVKGMLTKALKFLAKIKTKQITMSSTIKRLAD